MNLTDICCNNCPHVVVNRAKPGRDYPLIFDLLSKQNSLVLHSNKTDRIITANISQIQQDEVSYSHFRIFYFLVNLAETCGIVSNISMLTTSLEHCVYSSMSRKKLFLIRKM